MAYQALYRVWRSQRFEDVVGQKAITQTLKNAIEQNQISHAYLFTGPRERENECCQNLCKSNQLSKPSQWRALQ